MEFKRIPFIAVQRKFNLTDRQIGTTSRKRTHKIDKF